MQLHSMQPNYLENLSSVSGVCSYNGDSWRITPNAGHEFDKGPHFEATHHLKCEVGNNLIQQARAAAFQIMACTSPLFTVYSRAVTL